MTHITTYGLFKSGTCATVDHGIQPFAAFCLQHHAAYFKLDGFHRMHGNSRSQLFFREHIAENMREWEADPLKPHKAMNLAVSLNQMADYFFSEFAADPTKVLATSTLKEFRETLRKRSREFALIHDVADAHKHLAISRPNRKVTGAAQATAGALRWDEGNWNEAKWDSPEEMVINLDDGDLSLLWLSRRRRFGKNYWLALAYLPPNKSLEPTVIHKVPVTLRRRAAAQLGR